MTTKFMSPLVLQMRQVIHRQMLLLLSRVVFRLSGTGCMHDNKLLLNAWPEFLLISTKQQLPKVNISRVQVGNANIQQMKLRTLLLKILVFGLTQTFLRLTISLSLVLQRSFISTTFRGIRKYLAKECTETLAHIFILSYLDFRRVSYLEFPNAIFTNYKEFRMQLRAWYSRRADFTSDISAQVAALAAGKIV